MKCYLAHPVTKPPITKATTKMDKTDLILRGLHILIRTSFAPNEPQKQMNHFAALQRDIGPWLTDYVAAVADSAPAHAEVESN